jgi:hypothetical protein
MPVRGSDAGFKVVIDAIREHHPTVPVFVFGASSHPTFTTLFIYDSMLRASG